MVNQTILENLSNLVANARPMKKWSDRFRVARDDRLSWYLKKLARQIKSILHAVSGDDIVEMLKDVLTKKERLLLAPPEFKDALQNLVNWNNSNKRQSIIFQTSHF